MKQKFAYIGTTPAHGKIFEKGKAQIVVYGSGVKKYWPDFNKNCFNLIKRNKKGMLINEANVPTLSEQN